MICSPNILSFNFSFNSELWLHWHHHLDTAVMQHCSTWHTAVAQTVIILVQFNVNYWTFRNWSLISKPFYTKKQKHLHDGTRLDYFIYFQLSSFWWYEDGSLITDITLASSLNMYTWGLAQQEDNWAEAGPEAATRGPESGLAHLKRPWKGQTTEESSDMHDCHFKRQDSLWNAQQSKKSIFHQR